MENNIRNLEFYGIPGSGKTGMSHLVATELRKQGFNVCEPSYALDHDKIKFLRRIKKTLLSLELHICYPKDYNLLKKIVVDNGYSGMDKIKQLSNISYKLLYYKKEKDGIIYIWDEGLFQSSISLSTFNDKISKTFKVINELIDKKTIGVYIKANKEDSINRIMSREKHESRVEKLNNIEEIRNTMNSIEKCCDSIYNDEHILVKETKIEEAVLNILKQLDIKMGIDKV